mmetsp:Transcript_38736/g.58175  ORF Transcript_38736/g.58175 Transcript_38736/m.58175 type:complete len:526 (-) Transcript_38736:482-2059(-)
MGRSQYSYTKNNNSRNSYVAVTKGNTFMGRAAATSRQWVRSKEVSEKAGVVGDSVMKSETMPKTTMVTPAPQVENISRHAGKGGAILRGGPSSRVWRRSCSTASSPPQLLQDSNGISDQSITNEQKPGDGKLSEVKQDRPPTSKTTTIPAVATAITATNMKRQGTNKLLLSNKKKNSKLTYKSNERETSNSSCFNWGENKLVLSNENKQKNGHDGKRGSIVSHEESESTTFSRCSKKEQPTASRKRQHPLISSEGKSNSSWRRKDENGDNSDEAPSKKSYQRLDAVTIGDRKQAGNVRRIQLNASSSFKTGDECISGDEDHKNALPNSSLREEAETVKGRSADEDADNIAKTNITKNETTPILTDFAYRETSFNSGRGRGRNRTTSGQNITMTSRPQNMGLVRVRPNPKQTPTICPIILRGLACTDPNCTGRHDLSRESITPLCHHFQKNGLCLKGEDCPFRHVKVNKKAEICPSFAYLGYCTDSNCPMKHLRQRQQKKQRLNTFSLSSTRDTRASISSPRRKNE